jgi:SAM-dependent methyltransferase
MIEALHFRHDDAAHQWVTSMVETHVIPACLDPIEAGAAFRFFERSSFAEHRVRFVLTLDAIRRRVDLAGLRVAETGHMSGLSRWLTTQGTNVDELEGDFRYTMNAEGDTYDVLLSFEVLEHIKDQDHRNFDDLVLFNETGVRAFVREMHRVVKPGGKLILTTPNACSLYCVERAFEGNPPWLFRPHVREYSPNEVISLATEAGFKLVHFQTMYAHHHLDPADREARLQRYFNATSHSSENRGDDSFFVFEKN